MEIKNRLREIVSLSLLTLFLTLFSPATHAVVKDIQITDTNGKSLPNTKVTIVFPDGTQREEESDDDGVLYFDFPADGDYELRHSGGTQTVNVTGAAIAAAKMSDAVPATNYGFYAGIALGYADHGDMLESNDDGSLSNVSSDDSDLMWNIAAGYLFNDWVGVEVAYLDLGEADFTAESDGSGISWVAGDVGTNYEADGWLFSIIGRYPLTQRWAILARLGAFVWETTETFTENGFVSVDKNDGTDAYYGLGFEYDIGTPDKWIVRGDVARTEIDDDGNGTNIASVSFSRKF
ncbi:MAG: outer membrane beta-barrel protein [Gammaproteobacteria bacterium]